MPKKIVPCILSGILCMNLPAAAQDTASGQALEMQVVSGDHAVNSVTTKENVVPPEVRIRTPSGRPVPGVIVRFELPAGTSKGYFAGRESTVEVRTNERGEATATGYTPVRTGSFTIQVTALQDSNRLSTQIRQRNGSQPYSVTREHRVPTFVWALIGAGAAGLVIGLVKSRGSSPAATISVGSPTVGGTH